jgi:tetratricopeptide (TPR) repeat protein
VIGIPRALVHRDADGGKPLAKPNNPSAAGRCSARSWSSRLAALTLSITAWSHAQAAIVDFGFDGQIYPTATPIVITPQSSPVNLDIGDSAMVQVGNIVLDIMSPAGGMAASYYFTFYVNGTSYLVGEPAIPTGPNQAITWTALPNSFTFAASFPQTIDLGLSLGTAEPALLTVTFQAAVSQPTDQDNVVEAPLFVKLELSAASADSDGDGIFDGDELYYGTDPFDADSDDDSLNDGTQELFATNQTDPLDADSDDDGLLDGAEDLNKDGIVDPATESDPVDADTDDDGISDGEESLVFGTEPLMADSDADGLPDGLELGVDSLISGGQSNGSVQTQINFFGTDAGLFVPDLDPATITDPNNADTDGDGLDDGIEDANQNGRLDSGETDPLTPNAPPPDLTCLDAANAVIEAARGAAITDDAVLRIERVNTALDYATRALALDSRAHLAHYALALTNMYTWHWTSAANFFERAIAIDPNNAVVLSHFGWFEVCALGDPSGEARLARALALEPDHPRVHEFMARAKDCRGDRGAAFVSMQRAVELQPTSFRRRAFRALLAVGAAEDRRTACARRPAAVAHRSARDLSSRGCARIRQARTTGGSHEARASLRCVTGGNEAQCGQCRVRLFGDRRSRQRRTAARKSRGESRPGPWILDSSRNQVECHVGRRARGAALREAAAEDSIARVTARVSWLAGLLRVRIKVALLGLSPAPRTQSLKWLRLHTNRGASWAGTVPRKVGRSGR